MNLRPPSDAGRMVLGMLFAVLIAGAYTLYIGRAVEDTATSLRPTAPVAATIRPPTGDILATTSTQTATSTPPPLPEPVLPPVTQCSLHFSFASKTQTVVPSGALMYTLTLTNAGRETCRNASFSIYYSPNERFVSAQPHTTARNYYWAVGNLPFKKKYEVTVFTEQISTTQPFQVSNEACATADNSEDVCVDNLISLQTEPSVAHGQGQGETFSTTNALAPAQSGAFLGKEVGVWVWNTPLQMDAAYRAKILDGAVRNGFTTLYVTIDDYLDITVLPPGSEKEARQKAYFATLAALVNQATPYGLQLDVEGGAKDWALPENRWKGYALIDFVARYNRDYPLSKVRGLQYDVEPYLLPAYENDKATVLQQYLEFIDQSVTRMQGVDAQFSIVVPYFYNATQRWTPRVDYNGQSAYTNTHLLKILERKPGSTMLVMAYRDFFFGKNGTQETSKPDVLEAAAGKYATKILVAQETGNVQPAYVTFYEQPKESLFAALHTIVTTYAPYTSFGGVAVDYIDPFLQLR